MAYFVSVKKGALGLSFASGLVLLISIVTLSARSEEEATVMTLKFHEVVDQALKNSNQLKSDSAESQSALEHALARRGMLFPRLSLDANYRYVTEVPNLPGPTAVPFGSHSTYSIGPTLTYTLWENGATKKSYNALVKLAEMKGEVEKAAAIQLKQAVQLSYVRVNLALEELRLIYDSLQLAREQAKDIGQRFHQGASAKLEWVSSKREVISYQIRFQQTQSQLSQALTDLMAFLNDSNHKSISRPGPFGIDGVITVLNLESFQDLVSKESVDHVLPPDHEVPQLKSQELFAKAYELMAASQKSSAFPKIQLSARTSLDYPNGPVVERINQNSFLAMFSMPLFEGGQRRHEVLSQTLRADSARYRMHQLEIDLQKEFLKTQNLLFSLSEQRDLAEQDVKQSEEVAKLYYESFKLGKINLVDVQAANLSALQSKVNATRIDAQILIQWITLKALSGRDTQNGE